MGRRDRRRERGVERLQRLEVVSVTLDQGRDEPQLVFESMNSTGLDLETSDLVRNYMLMGCPVDEQAALYGDYWQPMERRFEGIVVRRVPA